MNVSTTSAPPRRVRKLVAPSSRDQQIYRDYQTTGQRQRVLAEKHKLTQCRISQIIRRVESGDMPAEQLGRYDLHDSICDWSVPRRNNSRFRRLYRQISRAVQRQLVS